LTSKKFIDKLVENWLAKVLSVAVALVIFAVHLMSNLDTLTYNIPLKIENNAVLIPSNSYVRIIKVTVRAEQDIISRGVLQESDFEAYIDLGKYNTEGRYRVPVQVRKKGHAASTDPLEIAVNPLEIDLRLDRKISKSLPLAVTIQGKVASGFDLVSHSISPFQVTVDGPLNALEQVAELRTDTVELDGRNGDFTLMVNIINPDPLLFVIRGNGMAEFSGMIRPSVPVRTIEAIPINLTGLHEQFEADTGGKTGSVRLEGNQLQLDIFVPSPDFLVVDCSALTEPGTYTLPVVINLPPEFSLVRREPEEIAVTVNLKPVVQEAVE
jgi:hypothetical protein